jgi:hypothetical protein
MAGGQGPNWGYSAKEKKIGFGPYFYKFNCQVGSADMAGNTEANFKVTSVFC